MENYCNKYILLLKEELSFMINQVYMISLCFKLIRSLEIIKFYINLNQLLLLRLFSMKVENLIQYLCVLVKDNYLKY